jgi:hypothetical protein
MIGKRRRGEIASLSFLMPLNSAINNKIVLCHKAGFECLPIQPSPDREGW